MILYNQIFSSAYGHYFDLFPCKISQPSLFLFRAGQLDVIRAGSFQPECVCNSSFTNSIILLIIILTNLLKKVHKHGHLGFIWYSIINSNCFLTLIFKLKDNYLSINWLALPPFWQKLSQPSRSHRFPLKPVGHWHIGPSGVRLQVPCKNNSCLY